MQALLSDNDGYGLAVANPLRPGKEGIESAAQRYLIGRAPGAARSKAQAVDLEDLSKKTSAKRYTPEKRALVLASSRQGAFPRLWCQL
jgi:hypothetical protein